MYSTQKKAIYSSKMGKSWKNLVWKYGKNTEIEHHLFLTPTPVGRHFQVYWAQYV